MDIDQITYNFDAFGSGGPFSFDSVLTAAVFGAPPNSFVTNDSTFFGLSGGTASALRLNSDGTFCVRPDGDACTNRGGAMPDLASGTYSIAPSITTLEVTIDIKPFSFPNSINLCSNGTVPIAILGSGMFDVNDIDTDTLRFAEASVKMVGKKDPHSLCSYEDVNGDLIVDLVCHFVTTDIMALGGESTSATVNGELLDGTPFEGTDSVNIVKDTCN